MPNSTAVLTTCLLDKQVSQKIGVPGGIRTHDLQIRNLSLYPAELRGRSRLERAPGRVYNMELKAIDWQG